MTTTAHDRLVRLYLDDFAALQDAALARAHGTASPETAAALEDPALSGPVVIALAHADVLAHGDVRHGELEGLPPTRLRPLRRHATRVRRARSQAEAAYRERRAACVRADPPPSAAVPLELRLVRAARPEAYAEILLAELDRRGLPASVLNTTSGRAARWARERGLMPTELPFSVCELLDHDDDAFLAVLLADAREEENRHLTHDAVVERWNDHARVALAWGRYAIAQAERDVLTAAPAARASHLDALDDAYQDMAVLTARTREAKHLTAELRDRVHRLSVTGTHARMVADCHTTALRHLANTEPELAARARELAADHRRGCTEDFDGCAGCHTTLAAALVDDPSDTASDDTAQEYATGNIERYALLGDLPADAVVAAADAAIGNESALCGYGWAAEDGIAGRGHSYASGSGEAEVIGICQAALTLLDHHPTAGVVILCDSREAVTAVERALETGDPVTAHRTVLLPEGRALVERLLPHRARVQVRWLKGHIGHDLNEAADALAGIALAQAVGRIPEAVARRRADRAGALFLGSVYRTVA